MSTFQSVRRRRGFTLIELMVVMLIMGILMGMLLAGISRAMAAANTTKCRSNLKGLGIAIKAYETNNTRLPLPTAAHPNIFVMVMDPTNKEEDRKSLVCPSMTLTTPGTETNYQANSALFTGVLSDTIMPLGPSSYILVAENTGSYLLADATPMFTGNVTASVTLQTPAAGEFGSPHSVINVVRGDGGTTTLPAGFVWAASAPSLP